MLTGKLGSSGTAGYNSSKGVRSSRRTDTGPSRPPLWTSVPMFGSSVSSFDLLGRQLINCAPLAARSESLGSRLIDWTSRLASWKARSRGSCESCSPAGNIASHKCPASIDRCSNVTHFWLFLRWLLSSRAVLRAGTSDRERVCHPLRVRISLSFPSLSTLKATRQNQVRGEGNLGTHGGLLSSDSAASGRFDFVNNQIK